MIHNVNWPQVLKIAYIIMAAIYHGRYSERVRFQFKAKPERDLGVKLITYLGALFLAVIWPVTELVSLGMSMGREEKK